MSARLLERLLRVVFPAVCRSCGGGLRIDEKFFCAGCLSTAVRIGRRCTVCGLPYTFGSGEDHPCGGCLKEPPKFEKAAAPLLYEGVVEDAVKLFKYRKVRALKEFLGEFVASEAGKSFQGATVAVAVPLHPKRLRFRGFNQALFLAESAAKRLGIALSVDGLARVRHTMPQVGLGPEERRANVKGAFAVVRPEDFKGQAVLLVDDVYTTGATVKECARVLKKSGAKSVSVLTVARVNIR